MAIVDAYIPLDMLNGFDFSALRNGAFYSGSWSSFAIANYNGTFESFYGYGFTYTPYGPTGAGTVTDYEAVDGDGTLLLSISDINIPASWIVDASSTSSVDDDFSVIMAALAGNDTILGSDYSDVLLGFAGNDTIRGYAGDDFIIGGAGADLIDGGAGRDALGYAASSAGVTVSLASGIGSGGDASGDRISGVEDLLGSSFGDNLTGDAAANLIFGMDGSDYLNGGAGADSMFGGAGSDTYVVDNVGDVVNESTSGSNGTDTVQSSLSFSLANTANVLGSVENLTLLGAGNINGTGNGLSNVLTGNSGANVLNGAGGADTMRGNAGDDTYYVDNAADRAFEAVNQGTDAVNTSVSFALATGQQIEKLATTSQSGTGAVNLTGNEFAQAINGNNGVNTINGGGGNDTISGFGGNDVLYGGAGNDTLTGGAGSDHFVFNSAISATTNVDTITDFNVVADTIRLENAVMTGLGLTVGTLSAASFWKSTSGLAHDGNDRIIYETDTGWLNYDSNGSAAGGAVHIAKLAPNLALTNADFLVI